jgi:dolichol-phosphate mannosyltransferase
MNKDTLVVIPAYNEEKTIKAVVKRSLQFSDVCVVDDGSKDRTGEIVESIHGAVCITHVKNTHIPQAVLDGMRYGLKQGYKYVITMDAGLSHRPEELPNFTKAPEADLIVGFRARKKDVPLYRSFLSYCAKLLINFSLRPIGSGLPKAKFKDVTSGYRRYSRKAMKLLLSRKMNAKTFDFHTEALMLIYRNGLSIREIPITYRFTGSSLNTRVIITGIKMFLDFFFTRRK